MTEVEIKSAFAAFDSAHPFFQALLALLDNAVLAEQDSVTIPLLTDAARHFNAGRLAQAKDIRALLTGTMAQAIVDQRREAEKAALAAARREQ